MAAAYGAVPADECPEQGSADSEDYAVCMLSVVAMEPFVAHIDRRSTALLASSPGSGQGDAHPRANLWGRTWASFDKLQAVKTKAHCSWVDVARGGTTRFLKRGNDHADRLAKAGAALHGLDCVAVARYKVLAGIARQAARWAAQQYVKLRALGFPDTDEIPKGRPSEPRPRAPRSSHPAPASQLASGPSLQGVLAISDGHVLPSAVVLPSGHTVMVTDSLGNEEVSGGLVVCTVCWSCARTSWHALRQRCPGRASASRRRQRSRLLAGKVPWHFHADSGSSVAPLRNPSAACAANLCASVAVAEGRPQPTPPALAEGQVAWWPASPAAALSGSELFGRFGLDELTLQSMAAQRAIRQGAGARSESEASSGDS